jgi:hypothetical protein
LAQRLEVLDAVRRGGIAPARPATTRETAASLHAPAFLMAPFVTATPIAGYLPLDAAPIAVATVRTTATLERRAPVEQPASLHASALLGLSLHPLPPVARTPRRGQISQAIVERVNPDRNLPTGM